MYNKLLNKNVITAALVSLMTLGVAKTCEAQGVVSMVEEENIVLPQDNAAKVVDANNDFDEFGFDIDAEIPDALPEDEGFIPLDDEAMISPEPAIKNVPADQVAVEQAPAQPQVAELNQPKEAVNADTTLSAVDSATLPENIVNNAPAPAPIADTAKPAGESFDLGLQNTLPNNEVANKDLPATAGLPVADNLLPEKAANPLQPSEPFANSILSKVDNTLFSQMSDIEKQTTLLTLELRREKLRSEIDAVKAQRSKAEEEKAAAKENKKLKEFKWKKEQEAKVYKEQQRLKQKEIELEKIKQKKALVGYMNKMLEDKQEWMKENAELVQKLQEAEKDRNEMAEKFKEKLHQLTTLSNKFVQSANSAKSNHDRTIASLTAQNLQLKKRLEAETTAAQNAQQNPFNPSTDNSLAVQVELETPVNVAEEYAIMDITGKGETLAAKLINKEGDSFTVRNGTILQTGHIVDEITQSYIKFNINGLRQYLYLGTVEPERLDGEGAAKDVSKKTPADSKKAPSSSIGDSSAPTLGAGMFVK